MQGYQRLGPEEAIGRACTARMEVEVRVSVGGSVGWSGWSAAFVRCLPGCCARLPQFVLQGAAWAAPSL